VTASSNLAGAPAAGRTLRSVTGSDSAPPLRPDATLGVLDITKFYGPTTGGIRTYLTEKSQYVEHHPLLRQTVIVPGDHDAIEDYPGSRWYRLKSPPIPGQHPYRLMIRRAMIHRVIEQESPDIIEVGSPYLVPWICRAAARRLRVPMVLFYHTNFPRIISPRPTRDRWGRRVLGNFADRYVARLSTVFDGALAASNAAVRELSRAGFSKIEKVPLGVDLALFHPERKCRSAETRAVHHLPPGPLVMYVGRLAREKELHLVLDAWPIIEKRTGASLVLVGDGPSREYFQSRSRGRRVFWLPYERNRERLADLTAAADLVVAPGPAETFGLAALEALASGVPVVSSDQGAVRELVESSGAGMVNPEPIAESMARAIVTVLDSDHAALGARGRAYAERSHAWTSVFDRIFEAYQRFLGAVR
jgi:alpha-1,6-mannosyltransferase